mgnify:CR=1|jgi:hypothetical protein|tara:strand:- start:14 stop:655 length:642 start_codon:yes stop_codon:yes gene_type:complete
MQKRIEKKFIINSMYDDNIINLIENKIGFKEIFEERQINNVYFDDFNLSRFYANIDGNFLKEKWRLRWYGKTFGENKIVTLEQKSRIGNIQFKKTEMTSELNVFNNMMTDVFYDKLPNRLKNLYIINFNKYKRRYFANKDKSIRITVDKNVSYSNIFKEKIFKINKIYEDKRIILEIKSVVNNEDILQSICQKLPLRVSRNSKYVNGIISTLR